MYVCMYVCKDPTPPTLPTRPNQSWLTPWVHRLAIVSRRGGGGGGQRLHFEHILSMIRLKSHVQIKSCIPEEMSSLFCCSLSTSSLASFILSFMRSAVSLDLREISVLAAVKKTVTSYNQSRCLYVSFHRAFKPYTSILFTPVWKNF